MQRSVSYALCIMFPLALLTLSCSNRRIEPTDMYGDQQPASILAISLLDSSINDLVLEYGAEPVRFGELQIGSGDTVTRGRVIDLPSGGEIMRITYTMRGGSVQIEATVSPRPTKQMVAVAVLRPTDAVVEWHDADADVFDMSRDIKARHGYRDP